MDLFWDTYRAYLRSYLPQWRYDPDGGEPESAVLRAAAELIEESRARMADLPQKHELAFLGGWELEPLEAEPACACAALTAPEGAPVPAGTELYMSGDGARLWRTAEDAQAEPARLSEQFLTGRGKRVPLPLPAPEQLICGQLRDVLRTRCLRKADVLHIAVLMRDVRRHEAAFAGRREEIRRLLERDSVLPTLGLEAVVQEPVFYPINAMVWLRATEEIAPEAIRRRVSRALDCFFDPAAGRFEGEGWPIGQLPTEMEVRNFLQHKLPGLVIVRSPLTAVAPDGRELDCAHIGDPFSLPVPGAYTVHILRGEDLYCTPTVKTHVHNLLTKLNVSSRNQVRGAAERLKLL